MKELTESAKCAKMVKNELQKKYPNLKISVKSENYSMGDNVNVRIYIEDIEDMIIDDDISTMLSKYEYGSFDGMTDYYDINNRRNDIPQTKYLFFQIEYSPKITKQIADDFNKHWNGEFVIESKESESYHFKDTKIGYFDYTDSNCNYWIQTFIKKNYSKT